MAFLRKIVFLAAVAAPVAAEVACAGGSCTDETSLMQMKKVVKHGGERIPTESVGPSPVHDDEALVKGLSTKEAGELDAALDSNIDKSRSQIEEQAASDIDFTDDTLNKQREMQQAADNTVDVVKKQYEKSVAHEEDKVKASQAKRDAVEAAAAKEVKDAKEAAETNYLKKKDAQDVAALGRKIGEKEGEDAEDHAWADYEADLNEKQDQKDREEQREALDKQQEADRMDMADTKGFKEDLNHYVEHEKRKYQIAKADADADAHAQRYSIEGPEGINNKVTNIQAAWDAKHYDRRSENSQKTIEKAAEGEYPAGDWPAGPGDSPGAAEVKAEYKA